MIKTNHRKALISISVTLICTLVAAGLDSNCLQFANAHKGKHGYFGKSYYNTGGLSNLQIIHCASDATANGGNSHGGTGGNSNGGSGGSSNGGNGGNGGSGGASSGGSGGNGGPGGVSSGGSGGTSNGGTSLGGNSIASGTTSCSISSN